MTSIFPDLHLEDQITSGGAYPDAIGVVTEDIAILTPVHAKALALHAE